MIVIFVNIKEIEIFFKFFIVFFIDYFFIIGEIELLWVDVLDIVVLNNVCIFVIECIGKINIDLVKVFFEGLFIIFSCNLWKIEFEKVLFSCIFLFCVLGVDF